MFKHVHRNLWFNFLESITFSLKRQWTESILLLTWEKGFEWFNYFDSLQNIYRVLLLNILLGRSVCDYFILYYTLLFEGAASRASLFYNLQIFRLIGSSVCLHFEFSMGLAKWLNGLSFVLFCCFTVPQIWSDLKKIWRLVMFIYHLTVISIRLIKYFPPLILHVPNNPYYKICSLDPKFPFPLPVQIQRPFIRN